VPAFNHHTLSIMRHEMSKIVLPNVETCRWRSVRGKGAEAECTLVTSITGVTSGELSVVSHDACTACCRTFPPTPRKLNPVVASLVHTAATRILEAGGMDGCDLGKAERVGRLAEGSMDLIFPEGFRLTPARTVTTCCWLGDVVPSTDSSTGDNGKEPVFDCRHPAHGRVTPADCRMCRDWTKQPNLSRRLSLKELVPPLERRNGPRVKNWAVGVTTAPRRRPTLESCLDSIVRAGWDAPRLFLDGSTSLPSRYNHLSVTWREDGVGAWPAWYMGLAELLLQQPHADAYVLLQDDVILYDRESLRAYLEEVLWPGEHTGLVSLFYTGLDPAPGWRTSPADWHWGAQGFIFPPVVARALLCDPVLSRAWLAASVEQHIPIPELLCEWTGRMGIPVWYANPSLTQHIGNTSTIWMDLSITGGRRAPWFSGSIETPVAIEESMADFPEDTFPCCADAQGSFPTQVERGRRLMSKLSVVICGLCRDTRHYLPRTAARVERLGEMFRNYRVVLYENDSVDATREFLFDWRAQNPRVEVTSETLGVRKFSQSRSLDRAEWMARIRNRCRERVVSEYADFDYVIVLDMDLAGGWSYDGIAHTFSGVDWDFVGSYGLLQRLERDVDEPPFYHFDVWAFRPARGTAARRLVDHSKLQLNRGDPLLPVESCFGGLGVYRMACMQAGEYAGGDCEHVVFHNRLRSLGFDRLFLNPNQIVMHSQV
jgi:hypothetical protein